MFILRSGAVSLQYNVQMWMNALRTTEDAVHMLLVATYLAASTVPVILSTSVMALPARVIIIINFIRSWQTQLDNRKR